ncbi:MAG: response regulator transcription factor [Flavobacteriales bacterium]|nr:response regulator transcription factor [Flavobacteriales bacterium]
MIEKILILEDEVVIAEHLSMILEDLGYTVMNICESMTDVLKVLSAETPDLALLDIRLNGLDEGIEVAKHLRNENIPFAFVTSFSDKNTLMNAVMQNPLGYILKPFEEEDISKVLKNASKLLNDEYLEIIKAQSAQRIAFKDIIYLRSDNVYVEVYTTGKKLLVREKLSVIINKLPEQYFSRTNQSFCVNMNFVTAVEGNEVVLQGVTEKIPLSKKYRSAFFDQMAR